MFTSKIVRGTAAALLSSTALFLTACGSNDKSMDSHSTSSHSMTAAGFNDADVSFAQGMIPHHQQAVAMSTLADTRASSAEVKKLATQIKGAQQPEIDTMTGWLTSWGQPTAMPGGHMEHTMPGMMTDTDITALQNAKGTDFDTKFLTMMIAHHQGAITMSQTELSGGTNTDAKALAQKIITAQQGEIDTMRKLLSAN